MKYFAIDIDGTILGKEYEQYLSTYENLKMINDETNHSVTLVTARPLHMTTQLAKQIGIKTPVILMDGDLIYDFKNKKIIYENYIDDEYVFSLEKFNFDNHCVMVHTMNFICLIGASQHTSNFAKFLNVEMQQNIYMRYLWFKTYKDFIDFIKKSHQIIFNITIKGDKAIERFSTINNYKLDITITDEEQWWKTIITTSTANKINGIKRLEKYLNLPKQSIITIGNNSNDIEMLNYSTVSASVSDGTQEAKDAAKIVIGESFKNGVDNFIKEMIKEK